MSAWGRTGRVTVKRCSRFHNPEHDRTVRVDGKRTGGTVIKVTDSDDWFVEMLGPDGQSWSDNLPSLDAAVMWVLRRVDPRLWREERGAWLVRKVHDGEWVEDGWYTGSRYPAFPGWAIVDPEGKCRASAVSMTSALNAARRYVAEVVAR